ncbi:MAG: hypothetical protein LBC74_02930 [Planctomycetaceae bacterium]|nr:hypothetical protein [Planctomycetaceae bacterium]
MVSYRLAKRSGINNAGKSIADSYGIVPNNSHSQKKLITVVLFAISPIVRL